jgi:transposase
LSEFRSRLIDGQMEQRLLDELLERFRQRGVLKARSQQRTDSTHIQAAVRNLNRLEMLGETLRHALDQLAVSAPEWLKARAPRSWYERYGARFEAARLPKSQTEREQLALQIGQDGYRLLGWAYAADTPEVVRKHPAVEILRRVWLQQYYLQEEQISLRKSGNLPPSELSIVSPFDPEARFSIKRQTGWLGYKAHLSEVCEDHQPHWVTHVETTVATVQDGQAIGTIHAALAAKNLLPSQHFVDMGYVDTDVLSESQTRYGVEVIGPIQQDNTWQAQSLQGLDISQFEIDWERQVATCPQGKTSLPWKQSVDISGRARIDATFHVRDCRPCPLRADCTHSAKKPRILSFKPRPEYELLQWARQREQTPEFKESYRRRAGIEGTISQTTRSFDLRRSRYIGQTKTHLQHILTAIAVNLIRFVNWLEALPLAKTRFSPFTRLARA